MTTGTVRSFPVDPPDCAPALMHCLKMLLLTVFGAAVRIAAARSRYRCMCSTEMVIRKCNSK